MSGKYYIPDEFWAVHNKLYGILRENNGQNTQNKGTNIYFEVMS